MTKMGTFHVLLTPGAWPVADLDEVRTFLSGVTVQAAASIRSAALELDLMTNVQRASSVIVLVVALEDLTREPGSVQDRLAQLQQQRRLILIATCHGAHVESTLIFPIRIDVLTGPPFTSSMLAQHIKGEIERRRASHSLEHAYDVLSAIGAPILVVNLEGIVTWANAVATELLKVDHEPFIGQSIERALALVHRIGTDHRIEQQLRAIRPDTTVELGDLVVTCPRGMRIRFSCTARRARHLVDEIVLLLRDITVQHAHNAQYRLSAKVFEHSGEAIMITDHQDCILKVNAGFTQLTDYPEHEVVGRLPTFLNAGSEPASFYEALWHQVHTEGHWNGELWHRRKSGGAYAAWCAISAVRDSDGEVDHYVSIFTDVTERKMRDEHRLYQSQHDMLTGLPNRVLLVDRFAQIAARHARHAAGIALLFIDLDGFKPINDSHGHHVGDALLRVVAERLCESVRGSDTVSRYGGDEFVCLLDGLNDAETPQRVAMAILDALDEPIIIGSNSLHISASIGVAISRGQVPDLTLLMARADEAMYHAKRSGRGRWHLAPDESL